MKKVLPILLMFVLNVDCFARYPMVKNYGKSTYKAGAQNWCIAQGQGGNMWFANSGIMEYDGAEWSSTNTSNMTSVRSLKYDEESERMYFGATNEFGYIRINSAGHMEYISLFKDMDVNVGDIWAIHKIGDHIWLRDNNSMYMYESEELKQFSFNNKISASSVVDDKILIFVNNRGVLSAATDEDFRLIPGTESLKNKRVCSILPYKNEKLLFVTATDGVFVLDEGRLSEFHIDFSADIKKSNVYCAATDGRYLAFGTVEDGVYIKDMKNDESIHVNTFSGLQNNTVLSMFFDHNGNLWLGLDKGIDMLDLYSPEYRLFGDSNQFGSGYASAVFNGHLWLGTNQGLYVLKHADKGIADDSDIKSINEIKGQVWSLLEYDGRLFCCHDKGIYIFKDDKIKQIPMNGAWKVIALKDNPDYLLGSSYDRMFLLKKSSNGEWNFVGWIEGFEEASKVFEEDADGKIWFSHWLKGLFYLSLDVKNKTVTSCRYFSSGNGFPKDWGNTPMKVNDEIIFHTSGGFYEYDRYSEKVYPSSQINSLFNTNPAGMSMFVSDDDIYFSSPTMQAFCYFDEHGSRIMDTLSLRPLCSRRIIGFEDIRSIGKNSIMVNTEDGFSLIDTEMLKNRRLSNPDKVYIKEIRTKDSLIFSSRKSMKGGHHELRLPHRYNTLKLNVALPVYDFGNMAQYSFMLENYDSDWSAYSAICFKEYTKLPYGKYIFHVRAKDMCSADVSEDSICFTITPPWYLSKPAILIYIILGLFLCRMIYILMYRYSIKRARLVAFKKEEELRRKQMRTEFEHKAHDLAASTMNVIRKNEILLEIDSQLEKVAEYMGEDRNRSLKILSRIRHDIRENIQHDDVWDKFERNFDIVYDDYLKRLGAAFSRLTMSDKKICAYLKMGLSSKDIAPLLNITTRSVEMTRYRLRKKLGLKREESLTDFLQKF